MSETISVKPTTVDRIVDILFWLSMIGATWMILEYAVHGYNMRQQAIGFQQGKENCNELRQQNEELRRQISRKIEGKKDAARGNAAGR